MFPEDIRAWLAALQDQPAILLVGYFVVRVLRRIADRLDGLHDSTARLEHALNNVRAALGAAKLRV